MADVRDAMSNAEEQFPEGVEKYSINEINFSEFPIIIVNLTGQVPERTMSRIARDLQEKLQLPAQDDRRRRDQALPDGARGCMHAACTRCAIVPVAREQAAPIMAARRSVC